MLEGPTDVSKVIGIVHVVISTDGRNLSSTTRIFKAFAAVILADSARGRFVVKHALRILLFHRLELVLPVAEFTCAYRTHSAVRLISSDGMFHFCESTLWENVQTNRSDARRREKSVGRRSDTDAIEP